MVLARSRARSQGSLLNTTLTFLAQSFIFIKNSIPELSGHMREKYGEEWVVRTKFLFLSYEDAFLRPRG